MFSASFLKDNGTLYMTGERKERKEKTTTNDNPTS